MTHGRPVVVTRPRAQAEAFAARARAAGLEPVVFPLLDIQPLADESALRAALARLDRFALVAFVSPNAIDAALRHVPRWPVQVPLAVVGEGSRQALAAHGIDDAHYTVHRPHDAERTDSQTLLDTLDLSALHGKDVLIVRGESGRELLADALRDAGVTVLQVPAYRRCAPALDDEHRALLNALLDRPCDWVVTSSEALRIGLNMARAVAGKEGVAKLQQHTLYVPHVRIAETAQALGFAHVVRTASGDEALLAALQSRP
ncbi:uroporphyrinogen III synthase [Oxalobacteraceae bacterium OM1]|nr:uroporphyrinogen III synthase [Oxalobacteraceae bacterium OM1]